MILLIDNFDSFTYNIVQAFQQLGETVVVARNTINVQEIYAMNPRLIVIGPGPGTPKSAGISMGCVLLGFPVFGICLGHQTIAEAFGAQIVRASKPMHGKASLIFHEKQGLFNNLPQSFAAIRYHSLIVDPQTLPSTLQVTAWTAENEIMGVRHQHLPIEGVQFHPDSVASEQGMRFFENALKL